MRVLITGISGFAGKHLAGHLLCRGKNQVMGVDVAATGPALLKEAGMVEYRRADLTIRAEVDEVLSFFRPEQVYHLAARSSVGFSWKDPVATFKANTIGGINLLESIREKCPRSRVLVVCTAEEYGKPSGEDSAISEDGIISPGNPYAVSKSALDFMALLYNSAYGIPVMVTRSFNHIGPGQSGGFVCSDFSKQIASIEAGIQEPVIMVGNLKAERDFLDVRDVVRAYEMIVENGRPGQAYNVCSGKKIKIEALLEMLISFSTHKNIRVKTDPLKFRPVEVGAIYGNNAKLIRETGWKPVYNIEDSLKDSLQYWRNIINNSASNYKDG
ncbi:MAG: GDP-mannose 4,6-dehydratase [Actinobacteria bacterium]|nr:GDP-mannose 4,6-dehydratase [Actinomycetota bacterium]